MLKEQAKIIRNCNLLRSAVEPDNYITAFVLINEVRKRAMSMTEKATADSVYILLLEIADELKMTNPFKDKDRFYYVYQGSEKIERLEWECAIAMDAGIKHLPVLPERIINLYERRFSREPETVLIAEAEKFATQLLKIVDTYNESKFVLTTQNEIYAKVLRYVFEGYKNVEILVTNIYEYEFMNRRFDLIFSCPAFGDRSLVENEIFMCREFDMVALENLALHLNTDGRLVITLPGRITFGGGEINDLRSFIQKNYTINEIAELPEGSLEFTGIKIYILDIENSRPVDNDVIIRRYSTAGTKAGSSEPAPLEVKDDTFVMQSELVEFGDWNLDKIFARQDEEYQKFQASSVRKEMLGNIAQVFRGKAIKEKDPAGDIGVVNISNIGDYEIDYEGMDHIQEEERRVQNYILREGDVLLPARGTVIRTAVFHERPYTCIASSNVIVIRPEAREINSYYLKIFLDSPVGNKLISAMQQGAAVMNISYKNLRALEIPLPNMDKQEEAANRYLGELKKYKDSIMAAESRWSEVLKSLQEF